MDYREMWQGRKRIVDSFCEGSFSQESIFGRRDCLAVGVEVRGNTSFPEPIKCEGDRSGYWHTVQIFVPSEISEREKTLARIDEMEQELEKLKQEVSPTGRFRYQGTYQTSPPFANE